MASYTTDTSTYKFNHTMIRVKDPEKSVKFYNFLGLSQIRKLDFEDAKFSLYFLGYDSPHSVSSGNQLTDREGLLELTHNYGTEKDANYKITNGNSEPHRGFGHVAITVDNIQVACNRLEKEGYQFQKKLTDGRQKNIAFVLDPDGYWVEIIEIPEEKLKALGGTRSEEDTNPEWYRFNHSMIRIKDKDKSLEFYRSVLGMSLIAEKEFKEAKFTLFFLGYRHGDNDEDPNIHHREGLLELTWNHGTETDPNFKGYHNGNDEPQGFGHICISVDSLDDACARFEDLNVNWKKRLTDGRMKSVAFILDPDNYWVEVIQNEKLKKRVDW